MAKNVKSPKVSGWAVTLLASSVTSKMLKSPYWLTLPPAYLSVPILTAVVVVGGGVVVVVPVVEW